MSSFRTSSGRRGPVLYGVTIPLSARAFLTGQLNRLAREEPVFLVYGRDDTGPVEGLEPGVTQLAVAMVRDPSPLRDLVSLWQLLRVVAKVRPRTVAFGTPKMGLIGTLAAWVLRVPRRVYVLYGLRFEGASGRGRSLLIALERVAMACATEVLALSESNRSEVLRLGLTGADKVVVLDQGAIGGVDVERFTPPTPADRAASRARFGIPAEAELVGFVGRLTPDKGLQDMVRVWEQLHPRRPDAWLLVVGPDESSGSEHAHLVEQLRGMPRVLVHGPVPDVEVVFAGLDVLLLLTRREGFGTVLVEAAACGVPSVTTRVSGTVDAVVDGMTGTLVALGDIPGAVAAVEAYLDSPELLATTGRVGRERVVKHFSSAHLDALWTDHLGGRAPSHAEAHA